MRKFFNSFSFLLLALLLLSGGVSAQEKMPFNRKVRFAVPPPCMNLQGFSFNETSGRWTSGSRAVVTLSMPEGLFDKPVSLEFEIEPFIVPEQVPVQRVTVMAEQKLAAYWRCAGPGIYTIPLHPEQVKNGRITLVFLMPDCYRPPDAEDDPYVRTFALFFRSVLLRREVPPVQPKPAIVIRGKHRRKHREKEPDPVKTVIAEAVVPPTPEPVKTQPEPVKNPPEKETVQKPPAAVPAPQPLTPPPSAAERKFVKLQTLVPEKEILFSEESAFFRVSGFSDVEKDGRRTNAHASSLRFVLPDLRELPLPALEFQAAPASEECVESVIRLNGNPVGKWKCDQAGKYHILLGGISRKGGVLTVTFELPGAKVPQNMEHLPGARELGLLFRSVKLIPDIRKIRTKPEELESARKISELQPFPVETAVLPGKSGKSLMLQGFREKPDGDAVNQEKNSSFLFRVPGELAGTSPVAAFEIEPVTTAESPVCYLNILLDSVPADSVVCTHKQKFFLRLKHADSAPVKITMECVSGKDAVFANSYRLKSVTLLREGFEIPPPLIEVENKQTREEEDRKWKEGKLE